VRGGGRLTVPARSKGDEAMTHAPTEARRFELRRKATPFAKVVPALFALVRRLSSLRANWRELRGLARLHDAHLADIGLSRADVDWAMARPWHEDPTRALARRMECRRDARRWAARFQNTG
jgi:uncharacterized protein YjiS (DUF1127 family)